MNREQQKKYRIAGVIFFTLYVMGLAYFLFFSEAFGRTEISTTYRYNLHLLQEIRRYLNNRSSFTTYQFLINIVGNVVVFIPFGFLLPVIWSCFRRWLRVLAATFIFSIVIETIQLVSMVGIFDVDDILLNTIGGLAGYITYFICRRIATVFFARRIKGGLQ